MSKSPRKHLRATYKRILYIGIRWLIELALLLSFREKRSIFARQKR